MITLHVQEQQSQSSGYLEVGSLHLGKCAVDGIQQGQRLFQGLLRQMVS